MGMMLRPADRPGDLGWMVEANGEVYAAQFGWDRSYEALVARIVADHARPHSDRRAGWIAELDGRRVGCVLCVPDEDPGVARLRVLVVTPEARGLGAGTGLVTACVDFARASGYRAITLWTTSVLTSARRIYEAAGFELVAEEPLHRFGHDLVGQDWRLDLGMARVGAGSAAADQDRPGLEDLQVDR